MIPDPALRAAVETVPAGPWAVGVSGGADSVALLTLLRAREDVRSHVVHLNHQSRGADSDADADFVRSLAQRLGLPATVQTIDTVLPFVPHVPANRSARFRAARFALFARAAREHGLGGVILAHHRLDQAETVFLRLMRGTGPLGLKGMPARANLGGLTVLRPLLDVSPLTLRDVLVRDDQTWREDASNDSPAYRRNRVRAILRARPDLADDLVALAGACGNVATWARTVADACNVRSADPLPLGAFDGLPTLVRELAARQWLAGAGVPVDEIGPSLARRFLNLLDDAASGSRVDFPGNVRVTRKRGFVSATRTVTFDER